MGIISSNTLNKVKWKKDQNGTYETNVHIQKCVYGMQSTIQHHEGKGCWSQKQVNACRLWRDQYNSQNMKLSLSMTTFTTKLYVCGYNEMQVDDQLDFSCSSGSSMSYFLLFLLVTAMCLPWAGYKQNTTHQSVQKSHETQLSHSNSN